MTTSGSDRRKTVAYAVVLVVAVLLLVLIGVSVWTGTGVSGSKANRQKADEARKYMVGGGFVPMQSNGDARVALNATLDKAEYRVGEAIVCSAVLRNTDPNSARLPVVLPTEHPEAVFRMELKLIDPKNPAAYVDIARKDSAGQDVFNPDRDAVVTLTASLFVTQQLSVGKCFPVKSAGEYELTIAYRPEEFVLRSKDGPGIGVSVKPSNTVKVKRFKVVK